MPRPIFVLGPASLPSVALNGKVSTLHAALTSISFALPAAEAAKKRFGAGTAAAVKELRKKFGLPAADTVDAATNATG